MPKDEFDFEDPLELNGRAFLTEEDTTDAMSECFVEEFMRMGYSPARMLALFRNPHYIGMHMVLQKRGEPYVRDCISQMFSRWGRGFSWEEALPATLTPSLSHPMGEGARIPLAHRMGEGARRAGEGPLPPPTAD